MSLTTCEISEIERRTLNAEKAHQPVTLGTCTVRGVLDEIEQLRRELEFVTEKYESLRRVIDAVADESHDFETQADLRRALKQSPVK